MLGLFSIFLEDRRLDLNSGPLGARGASLRSLQYMLGCLNFSNFIEKRRSTFLTIILLIQTFSFCQTDRVYLSTPTKTAIIDHEKKRTYVLQKEGMADAGMVITFFLLIFYSFLSLSPSSIFNCNMDVICSCLESLGQKGQVSPRFR